MGPFTETNRTANTIKQIPEDKDPTILDIVHRNLLVEYYPKEEYSPAMIEQYVRSDTHRDDFYERFMGQWVQKLNNPKENITDDSILFSIVPLSSAPIVLPTKQINNTNDEKGVNSSPTFSPTTSSNPINHSSWTPTLTSSTSHLIPPPVPPGHLLTPIQRLIHHNTRKYQNKEPKQNRSQPDYLDPESVLPTRTCQSYKLWSLVFS